MHFVMEHYDEILATLGTFYALVCGIVALTPTTADDDALARFQQRISLLQPRNVPGVLKLPGARPGRCEDAIGPMLVVLLCFAPLLGGCHKHELRRQVSVAEALDTAIQADAAAFEAKLRSNVETRIAADCPTDPDWAACVVNVAREEAAEVERWEASHNAAVMSRDLFVAALRGADEGRNVKQLLRGAAGAVLAMVDVANAFGARIDVPALILKAVEQ
jgi:hypothetical protein